VVICVVWLIAHYAIMFTVAKVLGLIGQQLHKTLPHRPRRPQHTYRNFFTHVYLYPFTIDDFGFTKRLA
jgi:hypothetical protein